MNVSSRETNVPCCRSLFEREQYCTLYPCRSTICMREIVCLTIRWVWRKALGPDLKTESLPTLRLAAVGWWFVMFVELIEKMECGVYWYRSDVQYAVKKNKDRSITLALVQAVILRKTVLYACDVYTGTTIPVAVIVNWGPRERAPYSCREHLVSNSKAWLRWNPCNTFVC